MKITQDPDGTWVHTIDVGDGYLYYGTGYATRLGCWWDGLLIQTACHREDRRARRAIRKALR